MDSMMITSNPWDSQSNFTGPNVRDAARPARVEGTPIFQALALQTLRAHEDEIDKALDLGDVALPDAAFDHALYAFDEVHPHWRLQERWDADAEIEDRQRFEQAFGPCPW